MKSRRLAAELLDELPPEAPEAQAARRDLIILNGIMGHQRRWRSWLRREFGKAPPRVIAELGAGDGVTAVKNLLSAFPEGNGATLILVDRTPCVPDATARQCSAAGWNLQVVAADVFDWLADSRQADAICANLFLHHFDDAALAGLFAAVARATSIFVAIEPRRGALGLAGVAALPLIGADRVTLHDGRVSVEAGFRWAELSALWPHEGWRCEERRAFPFSHWFCARRT